MPDRTPGKHALTFVLITVMIDMIGLGLIMPVLPGIIRDLTGADLSTASTIGGALFFAYAAMQFLFGPVIGNLSDAYGRRPVLLLSVLGLGIDYLLTAFSPTIAWLFVGRLIAGLFGASYSTANAYIADITAPSERGKAFGMIGAAFGVGFILGPALGGLLGEFGHRVPFFVAAGLSIANVVYGYFVLPETLKPSLRRPFELARANPIGSFTAARSQPVLLKLTIALFLFSLAHTVYPATWAFFTMYRYGWNEAMVGLSLASFGVVFGLVQATLVGPIIKRFGERRAATLSMGIAALTFFGYALASQGWMVFALIAIGCLQGVAMPAINALMSQNAAADAQGELQGLVASIQGIASIIGPLVMSQLFGVFTGPGAPIELPGAAFLAAAILTAAAVTLLARPQTERFAADMAE